MARTVHLLTKQKGLCAAKCLHAQRFSKADSDLWNDPLSILYPSARHLLLSDNFCARLHAPCNTPS
eukprot:1150399-Pelagomonas_calceolata.AAC.6